MSIVELIIFDCDGVLVDSEIIACRTVSKCLNDVGIALPVAEVVENFAGVSAATMLKTLTARFGSRLPLNFLDVVNVRTRESFDRDLKATEGVQDVLRVIPYRRCVASSSAPEKLRHSLELTKLKKFFDNNVFSATQVLHGKPAPDLFLFAASQMSVPPQHCAVVEDSVPGVQAASAAQMLVLGFTGGSHCKFGQAERLRKAGAFKTFSRMAQLPSLLAGLG